MKLMLLLTGLMLSQYVSEREAFHSPTAEKLHLNNVPTKEVRALVQYVAKNFFDPLREDIGSPLYITSFYRSPALNKAVGGATNSDHMAIGDTAAFDIDQDGKSKAKVNNAQVFEAIYNSHYYYKLIWEFGSSASPEWVHIGYSTSPEKNMMRKTYVAHKVNNKTIYTIYAKARKK